MTSITFDTYAFVKRLKDAGMPEEQARVLAETHTVRVEERLATRLDFKELETNLKRHMKEMELRMTHNLTLRIGGMMAASVAVVATLVKLL